MIFKEKLLYPSTLHQKVQLCTWWFLFSYSFVCIYLVILSVWILIFWYFCCQVHSVAWNCLGTKLASGSIDHTARVWSIDPHGHVTFSPFITTKFLFTEWDTPFCCYTPMSLFLLQVILINLKDLRYLYISHLIKLTAICDLNLKKAQHWQNDSSLFMQSCRFLV